MTRLVTKALSDVSSACLDNSDLLQTFLSLRQIVLSSYGPNGKLKTLQNNIGGHVTLTSSSKRMFPLLTVSQPIGKLMLTALQGHQNVYEDGGLFAAVFCLEMIVASLEVKIHRKLLVHMYELLLSMCIKYLDSENCTCKFKVDFCDLDVLLKLAKSTIGSKPGCCVFGNDVNHISQLLVQLFLMIDHTSGSRIDYLTVEGLCPKDSKIVSGMLFQQIQKEVITSGHIITIAYDTSLSGDSSSFIDVQHETSVINKTEDIVIEHMISVCQVLVKAGIGLVACQKVIHPRVKMFLRSHGVLTLDRLGSHYITILIKLTGGRLISSVHYTPQSIDYGSLNAIEYENIGDKTYIHLQSSIPVYTLVLCNRHEESVQELKTACKAAYQSLYLLLRQPFVLFGAGQWQHSLATVIENQIKLRMDTLLNDLDCTENQLISGTRVFVQALQKVAKSEPSCNDIANNENKASDVLDSFSIQVGALQVAIATANIVLGIEHIISIQDK